MNIYRIILLSVVLLVLRIGVEVVLGAPPPEGELSAQAIFIFLLKRYLPDALVVIGTLMVLARVQVRLLYVHALCVVVLHELLGAAFLFAVGWDTPRSAFWKLDYLVLVVSAIVGTEIGRRLRVRA